MMKGINPELNAKIKQECMIKEALKLKQEKL